MVVLCLSSYGSLAAQAHSLDVAETRQSLGSRRTHSRRLKEKIRSRRLDEVQASPTRRLLCSSFLGSIFITPNKRAGPNQKRTT